MFQTISHYSQDMLYVDIFIDEEYKLFMASPGIPLGAKGQGRVVSVLGNCTKCIDCDTRVSVVPPGALVLFCQYLKNREVDLHQTWYEGISWGDDTLFGF